MIKADSFYTFQTKKQQQQQIYEELTKQTDSQTENKLKVTKRGRVGGDKLEVKDQQIQTITYEIDKQDRN